MKIRFSVTKKKFNDNLNKTKNLANITMSMLGGSGIVEEINTATELYDTANIIMRSAGLKSISCDFEDGLYYFLITTYRDNDVLEIIIDKKGVPIPAGVKINYKDLDLKDLVRSYVEM